MFIVDVQIVFDQLRDALKVGGLCDVDVTAHDEIAPENSWIKFTSALAGFDAIMHLKQEEQVMKKTALLVCAVWAHVAWAQSTLLVDFRWNISHHCVKTSPAIRVKNIPAGTTHLKVHMKDLDSNNPAHGGGGGELMDAAGFPSDYTIESGALTQYQGPCPDNFTTLGHEYEITVSAANSDKQTLAKGSHKAPFSGKFVILQGVIGSP